MSSSYDENYAEIVVDFVVHLGGSTTDVDMVIVECSCCGGVVVGGGLIGLAGKLARLRTYA